jgi:rubrerythrin
VRIAIAAALLWTLTEFYDASMRYWSRLRQSRTAPGFIESPRLMSYFDEPLRAALVVVALLAADRWGLRLIVPAGRWVCPRCGYALEEAQVGKCPECGLDLGAAVSSPASADS